MKVGIWQKINELPEKLNTNAMKLKGDGVEFSGGEWQKIAIARMILNDKPICILDEPTASLDPIAEAEMYSMYNKHSVEKTTIFISHRLGSTKLADKILVLNNGKISETGNHEELLALKGVYFSLFDKQRSLYE